MSFVKAKLDYKVVRDLKKGLPNPTLAEFIPSELRTFSCDAVSGSNPRNHVSKSSRHINKVRPRDFRERSMVPKKDSVFDPSVRNIKLGPSDLQVNPKINDEVCNNVKKFSSISILPRPGKGFSLVDRNQLSLGSEASRRALPLSTSGLGSPAGIFSAASSGLPSGSGTSRVKLADDEKVVKGFMFFISGSKNKEVIDFRNHSFNKILAFNEDFISESGFAGSPNMFKLFLNFLSKDDSSKWR